MQPVVWVPPGTPAAEAAVRAQPPATELIGQADELIRSNAIRARRRVLCGRPLRAGQHLLRVHGTTVHARCSKPG
jgi:hypothetical protein